MDERPEESARQPRVHPLGGRGLAPPAAHGRDRRLPDAPSRPDSTPIEETLGALNELVEEGKVRWIGASNFSAEQIEAAEESARDAGYGALRLGPERVLARRARGRGRGAARRARSSGSASSRTSRSRAACSPASTGAARRRPRDGSPTARSRTSSGTASRRCRRFADARGIALLELAFGGLLAQPAVTSVIAGATKPEQVRANVAAGELELSPEDVEELRALR